MPRAARFEGFVRDHQHMVFATAVRLLGRVADAEAVTQDVFLRAYQHFEAIADSPSAAGWLRTVARNACLTHLARHRSRWHLFSELPRDDDGDDDETSVLGVLAQAPESRHDEEAQARRLEAALRRLPDAQRVPLVLFHFEGVSDRDIAGMLGVPLGKVKTDMHRGREALKRELIHEPR